MFRDVNIDSNNWCDMVFGEKNKKYGAYKLRQSSSKRHVVAFLVVVLITVLIGLVPKLYSVVKSKNATNYGPMEEVVELSTIPIEEQVPEENIIKQAVAPPPPPLRSTIQYVPPVIAKDDEVSETDVVRTQDEVQSSSLQISVADVKGTDEKFGVDIAELEGHKVIVEAEVEKPFEVVEQPPTFPGGIQELYSFLSKNIRYPSVAQESGIEGRVIVQFVVSKTGDITDVTVVRGIDPSCDKEAIRVVKLLPRWNPGKQRGVAVPVLYTLPVSFKLE
mgnify:CR=1 FL=1